MRSSFTRFLKSDDGAVTVDWVIITAAVVGLAVSVVVGIRDATIDESTSIGTQIGEIPVGNFAPTPEE